MFGLTTAGAIRAASGVLFALLGLACMFLARRPGVHARLAWGLAFFGVGFGPTFVISNFDLQGDPRFGFPAVVAVLALWIVAILGTLLILASILPKDHRVRVAGAALVAIYCTATFLPIVRDPTGVLPNNMVAEAITLGVAAQFAQRILSALCVACALLLAWRAREAPDRAVPYGLLALGLILYPSISQGLVLTNFAVSGASYVPRFVNTPILLVVALAWILSIERGAGRVGLVVGFGIGLAILGGLVEGALVENSNARYALGVARITAAALIAIAIFRHDLLRAGLRARTAARASGATVGIAAIFIVAQVALPFVSGPIGLLLGGLVAGGLTLAGPWIQRSAERRAGPDTESSFRAAVRMALKDGHITREEERHLVVLADHLGIRPARAYELRDEEEQARGAK